MKTRTNAAHDFRIGERVSMTKQMDRTRAKASIKKMVSDIKVRDSVANSPLGKQQ